MTIKKLSFFIAFFAIIFGFRSANAQARVAYIDSEFILEQMPEYRSAQKQLDEMAETWKKDVQKRVDEVDKLYKQYQAEWVLLPEEDRRKREEEVSQREKALNDFKKEKFGPDGELFKKRQQLIKPIQDKVFDAVQQLAKESAIDIILDKAGAVTIMYSNAKYDRSEDVLEILGVVVENSKNPKTPKK
ncbi:MAG: OmpH family outer membrane protein [Sphingobacteriales bacterium]|nr:MAG: OmpH family outer membrane protein [Sphingobacteriales bacterium]